MMLCPFCLREGIRSDQGTMVWGLLVQVREGVWTCFFHGDVEFKKANTLQNREKGVLMATRKEE